MTHIELDDELVAETMRITGIAERSNAVDAGLRLLAQLRGQAEAIEQLRGSFAWQGNLEQSRLDRPMEK